MGVTTFSGPVKAGDIFNTSGTTLGRDVANVGFVKMSQSSALTQATNGTVAGLYTTDIVIPANSMITAIRVYVNVVWNGAGTTFSVGTSATATELAVSQAGGTLAIVNVAPGADATRVNNWADVGATDVRIYVLSANTGAGTGFIEVEYVQNRNVA
ncbi:MAG: hypothetical protein ABFD60_15230 [Bryobacteraceae bacterium]